MRVHVCVCHLATRLISSYYSNMPGPAATVNNTVRRYESLIKMNVTHSNKADNSNQNSIQISCINSQARRTHTHTHTHTHRPRHTVPKVTAVYNDDYKNTPWYAGETLTWKCKHTEKEMRTRAAQRHARTHTHNHSLGKQVEGVQAFIFFYRRCAKSIFNARQGEAAVSLWVIRAFVHVWMCVCTYL